MASPEQEIDRAVVTATRKTEEAIRKAILGLEHDTMKRVANVSIQRGAAGECVVSIKLRS